MQRTTDIIRYIKFREKQYSNKLDDIKKSIDNLDQSIADMRVHSETSFIIVTLVILLFIAGMFLL